MQTKQKLKQKAQQIAKNKNFEIKEEISQGIYYEEDKVRNLLFETEYEEEAAIFKIYDDPRFTDEPLALEKFNQNNTSDTISAPQVYDYEMYDSHRGWLLMEKLPKDLENFRSPLTNSQRNKILNAYLTYRKSYPNEGHRSRSLVEELSADKFHLFRIQRWLELANNKESERSMNNQKTVLDKEKFVEMYNEAFSLIQEEFQNREMIWCHGHFKPSELFWKPDENGFYLIDFAHNKYCPEGYEFAFLIWADVFMAGDYTQDYSDWKERVYSWIEEMRPVADKLELSNFDRFIRTALIERILGTILADVTAADTLDIEEQKQRVEYLCRLFVDVT